MQIMSNMKAKTKAWILLIVCDVALTIVFLILLFTTNLSGYTYAAVFCVVFFIPYLMAPWVERTMLRREARSLAEQDRLDEK